MPNESRTTAVEKSTCIHEDQIRIRIVEPRPVRGQDRCRHSIGLSRVLTDLDATPMREASGTLSETKAYGLLPYLLYGRITTGHFHERQLQQPVQRKASVDSCWPILCSFYQPSARRRPYPRTDVLMGGQVPTYVAPWQMRRQATEDAGN